MTFVGGAGAKDRSASPDLWFWPDGFSYINRRSVDPHAGQEPQREFESRQETYIGP